MNKNIIFGMGLLSALCVSSSVQAALVGQIAVSLEVESSCVINGTTVNGNGNNFGELNFGTTPHIWTSNIDGQVIANGAVNGGLIVNCSTDVANFALQINGGVRGDRTLSAGSTDEIEYQIYKDTNRSMAYAINTDETITLTNNTVTIPIYGRIAPNATAINAGTYTDTLAVTLTF